MVFVSLHERPSKCGRIFGGLVRGIYRTRRRCCNWGLTVRPKPDALNLSLKA